MYKQQNSSSNNRSGYKSAGRSFGRSSRSSGGFSRSYSRNSGFGRGRSFGSHSRRNPYRDSYISQEMYISKAQNTVQESIYDETLTFSDFGLHAKLNENISKRAYIHPTKIQSQVIKPILEKRDVLGLASTGSGKTAAFLLPIINTVLHDPKKRCLIVAPTRELVTQIQTELRLFAANTSLTDVLIVGGAGYYDQIRILRRNPHFIIATPGRLIDLFNRKHINLASFDTVVLDEVDQMLDMGFINDIKLIISNLKSPRQSMFFSATMSSKIEAIANTLLVNPERIEITKQSAAKNVDQDIVKVGVGNNKIEVLHNLLVNTDFQRVLVFSRTKRGADDIATALRSRGHKCDSLHGNKSLNVRTKVLAMFKRAEIDILVATDVASRGIDVPDITHVINYDKPATYEDYIHRIGRTGRIGKKGVALTFV